MVVNATHALASAATVILTLYNVIRIGWMNSRMESNLCILLYMCMHVCLRMQCVHIHMCIHFGAYISECIYKCAYLYVCAYACNIMLMY